MRASSRLRTNTPLVVVVAAIKFTMT